MKETTTAERAEPRVDGASQATAVATREQVHPAVAERRELSRVAAQVAGQTWGKALDHLTRVAFARYLIEHDLDLDEVEILGGRIYKNAEYYMRRAQPLIRDGVIEVWTEFVNRDSRLDELAKSQNSATAQRAREEIERRLNLRIEHNIPEDQPAAVVAYVRIKRTGFVLTDANWCGNKGKYDGSGKLKDPVGDAEPQKTAITRALRRVLRKAAGYEPRVAAVIAADDSEDAGAIEDAVLEARSLVQRQRDEYPTQDRNLQMDYGDGKQVNDGKYLPRPAAAQPSPYDGPEPEPTATEDQIERLLDLADSPYQPVGTKEKVEAKISAGITAKQAATWIDTLEAGIRHAAPAASAPTTDTDEQLPLAD